MSTPNTDANADQDKTAAQLWAEELAAAKQDAPKSDAPNPASASAPVQQDPPEPNDKPVEANAPAPAAANPNPDDPYAGMHPAVRARLEKTEGLEARLRKLESHAGNLNSTVKNLNGTVDQQKQEIQRLNDELQAARRSTVAAGNTAPTQQAVQQASKSNEKWEALKAEFPEWAEAVEERLSATPQVNVDDIREKVKQEVIDGLKSGSLKVDGLGAVQPSQQVPQQQNAPEPSDNAVDLAVEQRVVEAAHPGWLDLVKTQEFVNWYNTQPIEVRKLGDSPVADDAIALLTSYKDFNKTQPNADELRQKRQQQLQEAATVTRGNSNLPAHKSIDDMSPKELWEYEAKQLEKQKARR
jgi:uncharacterized coiled-coil protein SlyX